MICSRCKRQISRDDTYITQQDQAGTQVFCSASCQVRGSMRPDIGVVPNPEKLNVKPKPENKTQIGGFEMNERVSTPFFQPLKAEPKPIIQGNVVDLRGMKK